MGTVVSDTHTVTNQEIAGFNHEITTAQLRLSEIVVKYSRPSCVCGGGGGGTIFEAFPVFHFLVQGKQFVSNVYEAAYY